MTEPAVACSDATNIALPHRAATATTTSINGRKWWISGAGDPAARSAIVMGKTDPDGRPHRRQSWSSCRWTRPA